MGKATVLTKETTYASSREWLRGDIVADVDDEVRTTVSHRSMWQTSEYWRIFCLNSEFIVRSEHQNYSHRTVGRGRGIGSLLISARWKVRGGREINGHCWIIDRRYWISDSGQTFIQWNNQTWLSIILWLEMTKNSCFSMHPGDTLTPCKIGHLTCSMGLEWMGICTHGSKAPP